MCGPSSPGENARRLKASGAPPCRAGPAAAAVLGGPRLEFVRSHVDAVGGSHARVRRVRVVVTGIAVYVGRRCRVAVRSVDAGRPRLETFEGLGLWDRLGLLGAAAGRILEPVEAAGFTPEEIERGELTSFWKHVLKDEVVPV